MANTPWGRRPSYGSELAKRKMAVDESKKARPKKKSAASCIMPFVLAAGAFYIAATETGIAAYAVVIGIVGVILGIYWCSK